MSEANEIRAWSFREPTDEWGAPYNEETQCTSTRAICDERGNAVAFAVVSHGLFQSRSADLELTGIANLIVTAPELLESLLATQKLLERLGLESSDEYSANAAAIAKAEGKA